MQECLARFHGSEQAKRLRDATKTATRPDGVAVGNRLLRKCRCPCVRVRGASECDDYLTTAATINLPKWNKARKTWLRDAATKGVVCQCRMHTQARAGQPALLDRYNLTLTLTLTLAYLNPNSLTLTLTRTRTRTRTRTLTLILTLTPTCNP
jgi:hypothetical protein